MIGIGPFAKCEITPSQMSGESVAASKRRVTTIFAIRNRLESGEGCF
jgi:hypothetical protein